MSNMTGLGRYQRGKELEKEGLSGAQIATRLGYKDAQAWYTAKNYYGKNTAAFNARAAAGANNHITGYEIRPAETSAKTVPKPEVEPVDKQISAQLLAATKAMLKPEKHAMPEGTAAPEQPKLKMEIQLTAEGKALRYRLNNSQVTITRMNSKHGPLILSIPEALTMLEEVKELLKA